MDYRVSIVFDLYGVTLRVGERFEPGDCHKGVDW